MPSFSEKVYLPDKKKTIKPLNLGGVIGGKKYIVHNMLFKFAVDSFDIFGDEAAAKIAGHELKGLKALFNKKVKGLSFPLVRFFFFISFFFV